MKFIRNEWRKTWWCAPLGAVAIFAAALGAIFIIGCAIILWQSYGSTAVGAFAGIWEFIFECLSKIPLWAWAIIFMIWFTGHALERQLHSITRMLAEITDHFSGRKYEE
jgi:hypothetical protein